MVLSRYLYAADLCSGRRVVEIACGSGQGLGLLKDAAYVVGSDLDPELLARANETYRGRVPLVRFNAEELPLLGESFDLVLFFEASYYVPHMDRALDEICRVLAPGGLVMFVNANPERQDFIRSPYSHHYYSAREFRTALESRDFSVEIRGAFRIERSSTTGAILVFLRRTLERLRLVPRSLEGRARLKRLLFGKPVRLPGELDSSFAEREPLHGLSVEEVRCYKVLYVTATKR